MSEFDLLLKGGRAVTPAGIVEADIAVKDGKIAGIGKLDGKAAEVFDATGLTVLPGVIDSQVHLREPGLEYKEDLATGTAAAAMGGVTGIFEMPNTKPSTTTAQAIADKFARAKGRAWVDHAFYVGGAPENADQLAELERLPGVSGVKIFMGSSTGSLLVDDETTLKRALASGRRRVAIHAEDETRLKERRHLVEGGAHPRLHPEWRDDQTAILATLRVLRLAREANRPVHVLHITTADEIEILSQNKDIASVEVTPQHLTLSAPDCYDRLGTLAQMNPPIRGEAHRQGLWRGIRDGIVDVIGSDHAPHTLEEKGKPYPNSPSGMTGVQTLVPIMLDHVAAGRLTLERFVDLTAAGPARLFGLKAKGRLVVGYDADFTVVDLKAQRKITNQWIVSKCGWTPFDGMKVTGWPIATIIRGNVVMREDSLLADPIGAPLRFL
jgi:dihydroorotase